MRMVEKAGYGKWLVKQPASSEWNGRWTTRDMWREIFPGTPAWSESDSESEPERMNRGARLECFRSGVLR